MVYCKVLVYRIHVHMRDFCMLVGFLVWNVVSLSISYIVRKCAESSVFNADVANAEI